MKWTRSKTQGGLNEEIVHTVHSIQNLLDQHHLVWHDYERHPDWQFTSFIHVTKKTVPGLDDIMGVRRGCKKLILNNPSPLVESDTDWRDQIKVFGFTKETRKQGNEYSLCGLTGTFATSINVIIVTTSGHHTVQYNPPNNHSYSQVIWLIYLDLEHTRGL